MAKKANCLYLGYITIRRNYWAKTIK